MRFQLILISLVSVGLYALLSLRVGDDSGVVTWGVWAALFVAYAVAVRLAAGRSERGALAIIFMTSLLCRGALLLGPALELPSLDASVFGLIGPTPLTNLGARLGLDATVERIITAGVDLVALALAPSMLKAARIPGGAVIIHGWNPLVVTEVAGAGRLELVAFALFLLALRLVQKQALWPAAIVYGVSLTGPLMLAATLPLAARAMGARVVLALGVALAGWSVAFPETGLLELVLSGWPPPSFLGGSVTPAVVALASLFVTRDAAIPLAMVLAAWAVFAVARAARLKSNASAPLEALLALGGLMCVSPQMLPWGFVPIAYLAAYSKNRGWIAFTATAPITYLAAGGAWSFWLGFAQYFVPYALLIFWWLGPPSPRRRRGRPPHEAAGKTTQ